MSVRKVMETVIEQSENCERGFLSLDSERSGLALVGPNSVMWAWVMLPGTPFIFDLYLN